MATREYRFEVSGDEDGGYVAQCVQIPGVITQGDTLGELAANAREALEAMLESRALAEHDSEPFAQRPGLQAQLARSAVI